MERGASILSVAVPRPIDGLFTYLLPGELAPRVRVGGWVRVPFGRSTTHAYVVESPRKLHELPAGLEVGALKQVVEVGDESFILPTEILALCKWAHEYYRIPLGEALLCAAPAAALGLRTARREPRDRGEAVVMSAAPALFELTTDQKEAIAAIETQRLICAPGTSSVTLLHGVTGSGKTEVYLELARRTLAEGKTVLLLVPEIALTPQLQSRVEAGLGTRVGTWHSALPDGERRDQFAAILSGSIRVVVGARSAVFAPLRNVGLIVVDEEHDSTFKQEERARYHARDLAIIRARAVGATVILGSATPSLETRERAREGKYATALLKRRIAPGGMPVIETVDLREAPRVEGIRTPLAEETVRRLRETVEAGSQAMVFLNRRGFAAFLVCLSCGEVESCPHCSISLTVHKGRSELRCHVCAYQVPAPGFCGKCHGSEMEAVGSGTEGLEDELSTLLPGARLLRLDRDRVTSAGRLGKILDVFRSGRADILLGTQMLVKGHDFPGVTLVVVVLADALFRWPDFRAAERGYQTLTQFAGRAGRGENRGSVLIQTYQPDHVVVRAVRGELSEELFLDNERAVRKALGYPPFGRLCRLRVEGETRDEVRGRSTEVARWAADTREEIDVLGPSEAFVERVRGVYRWDILLKSRGIEGLQRAIARAKEGCLGRRWPLVIDVDPQSLG